MIHLIVDVCSNHFHITNTGTTNQFIIGSKYINGYSRFLFGTHIGSSPFVRIIAIISVYSLSRVVYPAIFLTLLQKIVPMLRQPYCESPRLHRLLRYALHVYTLRSCLLYTSDAADE